MREKLQQIEEIRTEFSGTFARFGEKNGFKGPLKTILLRDVKDKDGQVVTDHLWFDFTKGFARMNLQEGDTVLFNGRVKEYTKGYRGYREDVERNIETDYRLSHPTKISVKRDEKTPYLFHYVISKILKETNNDFIYSIFSFPKNNLDNLIYSYIFYYCGTKEADDIYRYFLSFMDKNSFSETEKNTWKSKVYSSYNKCMEIFEIEFQDLKKG